MIKIALEAWGRDRMALVDALVELAALFDEGAPGRSCGRVEVGEVVLVWEWDDREELSVGAWRVLRAHRARLALGAELRVVEREFVGPNDQEVV